MDLGVFWRSLRQRWYLVLALVVLTGAATFLVAHRVGPTYEATGTVLVFPPSVTEGPGGGTTKENPYLSLAGVTQARDVLVRALTAKNVSDEFGKKYPGTSFEVVPDYTNSAPIILFTVESATPEDAGAALEMLMDRVPGELSNLQAGLDLPPEESVTAVTLTTDERPTVTHKGQIRAGILVAAVLGGMGLLVIALVDGLLAGRRRNSTPDEAPIEAVPDDADRPDDAPAGPTGTTTPAGPPAEVDHPEPVEVGTGVAGETSKEPEPAAATATDADTGIAGYRPAEQTDDTRDADEDGDAEPAAGSGPEAAPAEPSRGALPDARSATGDKSSRRPRKRTRRRTSGPRPEAGPPAPAPAAETDEGGAPSGTGGSPEAAADDPHKRLRKNAPRRPPTKVSDGKPGEGANAHTPNRSPAGVGGDSP